MRPRCIIPDALKRPLQLIVILDFARYPAATATTADIQVPRDRDAGGVITIHNIVTIYVAINCRRDMPTTADLASA